MTEYCPHCGLSLDDATEQPETTEIKKAIRDYFRLTPMWIDQKDLQFIAWARKEKITRQQIERAARTWKENSKINWDGKRLPTLKDIAANWLDLIQAPSAETIPDRTSLIRPMGNRNISADDVGI